MSTEPRGGRPRVGDPARELPDGRVTSRQSGIVLADGQRDQLAKIADRLRMPGSGLIRRAIERLVDGHIPRPTRADQIPPPEPPNESGKAPQRTVVLPAALLERLGDYAARVPDRILFPKPPKGAPPRRGRPGNRSTQARDALTRYALSVELAAEQQALSGKEPQ